MKKYQYKRQLKCLDDDVLVWEEWNERLFSTKEKIEKMMKIQLEQKNFYHLNKCYKVVDYEVKEVEINNIEIEGVISGWHIDKNELYVATIDNVNFTNLIINKFEGQKVKIKVEVI